MMLRSIVAVVSTCNLLTSEQGLIWRILIVINNLRSCNLKLLKLFQGAKINEE